MEGDVLTFKSPGIASIFMLKSKRASLVPLIEEDNCDEDDDIHIKAVARKIKSEVKNITLDESCYNKLSKEQ